MKIPRWLRNTFLAIGAIFLVAASLFLFAVAVLPSPQKILAQLPKKSDEPLVLPSERKKEVVPLAEGESSLVSSDQTQVLSADVTVAEVEVETLTDEQVQRRLIDDLVQRDRPVSNFCRSLSRPNSRKISHNEFSQLAKVSVITENEDPRIQSMKPFLRTVMRMPQMRYLVDMVERLALKKETSFMESAEFYAQIAKVYSELKSNNAEISAVLDRSYLLHGLNQLLTTRPDLIGNDKVKNFCDLVEEDFNQLRPVDYTSEKRQFVNLLEQFGLSARDIGFDVDYRSDLSFRFNGVHLKMDGGWVNQIFIEPSPNTVRKDK